MSASRRGSALAALALGVAAISWSAIFVRWTHMPGAASAFYRVLFAACALWPVVLLLRLRSQPATHPRPMTAFTLVSALLGGFFFSGDIGLYNIAVLHTSAGDATLLGNNAPIFVGVLAWALTRKPPSPRFWTALAISLAGSFLIVAADARTAPSASSADLLAVIASLCFALYLLTTERLRDTLDTLMLLALSTTASAVTLGIAVAVTGTSLRIPNLASWLALLGLALICQVAGYLSLTWALGHLPATATSITMLAVGPCTALLALWIFGERMSRWQIAGGVLVLAGVGLVNRSEKPAPHLILE